MADHPEALHRVVEGSGHRDPSGSGAPTGRVAQPEKRLLAAVHRGAREAGLAAGVTERGWSPEASIRRLYFDTILHFDPPLKWLIETYGASHVMLGSDYPFDMGLFDCVKVMRELANEGRTTSKGMPKPLDLALFTQEYADEVQGAFPPVWVQRATLAPLAWLAKRRGHGERYTAPRPAYAA